MSSRVQSFRPIPTGAGRIPSPLIQAQELWAGCAPKQKITELISGRGGTDLLRDPAALSAGFLGEFRYGRGPLLTAYRLPVAGPDDRPVGHLIVREPVVGKDDRPTGEYNYYNLGPEASGGPNI